MKITYSYLPGDEVVLVVVLFTLEMLKFSMDEKSSFNVRIFLNINLISIKKGKKVYLSSVPELVLDMML